MESRKQRGFFEDETFTQTAPIKKYRPLRIPNEPECSKCPLGKVKCLSPKMPLSGKGRKGILVISEASGEIEDQEGKQLVGPAGLLLRKKLRPFGINLDRDCWKTNAVCCRPPGNRKPNAIEVKACRPQVLKAIRELKPKKIFLFGGTAIESVYGHRFPVKLGYLGVSRWMGQKIPDQLHSAWVFPMYHPSYLLRRGEDEALDTIFKKHLELAINHDVPFPDWGDEEKKIEIVTNMEDARAILVRLMNFSPLAIDWEATGRKPHAEGHRIVSMSISNDPNWAAAFPMFTENKFLNTLKRLLRNPKIKKRAQSVKFEDTWARVHLGYKILGWDWDTLLASHCLDNRRGVSGLKFQVLVRYGTDDYGKEAEPFITSKEKSGNAINRIDQMPLDRLLTYGGMDGMFDYRLAMDQEREFRGKKKLSEGYQLLFDTTKELTNIEGDGIRVDTDYCNRQDRHLERKVEWLKEKIYSSDEIHKWRKHTGKGFNPKSDTQLRELLFNVLDYEPDKETAGESASTDNSVLEEIGTPFTKNIITCRRLDKIRSTYLSAFAREAVNGYMHPFFNLNIPVTFRPSSSFPNFQNVPYHNKEAQKICRRAIRPRPGRQILGVDYSGVEVCVSACYHKDTNMIKYIKDPSTDMHRDSAMDLLLLEIEEITKGIRTIGKLDFVFAEFYGDYYRNCAKWLWRDLKKLKTASGIPIQEHLRDQGIKNYQQFEDHVAGVEHEFWTNKFKVYAEWKKEYWARYQRLSYIDMLTGFRCIGLMSRNDVCNYPIQGSAAHLMFWSLIEIGKIARKEKWESKMIGEIHDELVLDIVPDEKEEIKPVIRKVMCKDTRKHWPWIIVPLDIEATITEVDGNWFAKKEEPI